MEKYFTFRILAGNPEDEWIEKFRNLRPDKIKEDSYSAYPIIFRSKSKHRREEPNSQNVGKIANDFLRWIKKEINSDDFKIMNKNVIEFLPQLEKLSV